MTAILYAKLGAGALIIAVLFGAGWHFGAMASKTQYEALRAEQSELTAKAVLAERASAAAESARVNAVLKEYQDAPIDPVVAGTAHRVFIYANSPSCPVPEARTDPARVVGTAAQPVGPSRVERSLGDYIAACDADARQLAALIEAWPR